MTTSKPLAILRDQMTLRRLRLACGCVMFSYLSLHFSMHALGNLSWQEMEWGTRIHDTIWHIRLVRWRSTARSPSTSRSPSGRSTNGAVFGWAEASWTRLFLGFSILPLLFHHFAAGRYVYSAFDVRRGYDAVLTVYFAFQPFWGWRQIIVLMVAWTHGCLGMHFWLRVRPGYRRFAPTLLVFAVLLPVSALLGISAGRSRGPRPGYGCTRIGCRRSCGEAHFAMLG